MKVQQLFSLIIAASLCCFAASIAPAQNQSGSDSTVVVYHAEDGIAAPELRPTDFSPILANDCKYHGTGTVRMSLFVDSQGKSQNIVPVYPFSDDLERMALGIARIDHFAPGTKGGVPIAVAQELEIKLTLCTVNTIDEGGNRSEVLRLKSPPVQKLLPSPNGPLTTVVLFPRSSIQSPEQPKLNHIGGGVSAPVPLRTPEAEYPLEQRKANVGGTCLISLIVDADGMPQDPRVVRSINEELDQKSLEAVAKYRFKPAMKGKERVPVRMVIEVNFRLY